MRRLILSLIVMLSSSFFVWADDWVCMNIQKIPEDLTASIYERKDTKGKACALLRVQILDNNAKFKGNIVGDVERQGNEYLVYIPINTREITILPSKGDKVIIDLPETEPKVTYLIEMSQGETSLDGKQLNYNAMSVEELTVLANKNNSLAQRKLGEIYSLGLDGQSIDYKKGFMWFTKAALQGDAYSMCEVGKYYFGGYGIPKDLKKAYDWFSKSAEKNNANAQFMLGSMYFNAVGVEQDFKKAMTWFQKSAAQGYALGYTNTGLCYYNGLGVEKNPQKALEYTQKAAMMGCSQAQCLLGMMYGNDEVKELYNPKQAFFWMKMSADQGWSLALYYLGMFYEEAFGTPKDIKNAKECYKKALELGVDDAKKALDNLN